MERIMTPTFRVAFPQVFTPKDMGDGKPKYSVVMLFNHDAIKANPWQTELWKGLKAAAEAAAAERWPKGVADNMMSPFKDGMEKQEYDGYGAGVTFINAKSMYKPGLIASDRTEIIDASEFYGGCYARATVSVYAWEYMKKTGVNFGLLNVQKVKDGDPFGGNSRPEDDFDTAFAVAEDANTDDLFN